MFEAFYSVIVVCSGLFMPPCGHVGHTIHFPTMESCREANDRKILNSLNNPAHKDVHSDPSTKIYEGCVKLYRDDSPFDPSTLSSEQMSYIALNVWVPPANRKK